MIMPGDLETRSPLMGESLDGFIAEMTAKNGLLRLAEISRSGGVEYAHRPTLTRLGWDELPALADLLDVDVEELRSRSHRIVPTNQTRRQFFGSTIHCADIRTRRRFFSPSALALSEHHRALWQFPFPWDLETGELLRDTCPECDTVQRWRHSVGVRYCDHDAVDLSAYPTERLPEDVLESVCQAIGLIHPDPAKRAASMDLVPVDMRHADGGEVLEFILRLTTVVHPQCRWTGGERCWDNPPLVVAEAIARAWRFAMAWPDSMTDLVAEGVSTSEARGGDGNGGATRRFLQLPGSRYVTPHVSRVIRQFVANIDLTGPHGDELRRKTIGVKEAARITSISDGDISKIRRKRGLQTHAIMRAGTLVPYFDRSEVLAVDRMIKKRWDLKRATTPLGIPLYGVEQIVAMGDLDLLEHPLFALHYPCLQTTEAEVLALSERIRGNSGSRPANAVPIVTAIRRFACGLKPWGYVVRAMLAGCVRYHVDSDAAGPLMSSIVVEEASIAPFASQSFSGGKRVVAFSTSMTRRDAAEVLNIGPREATALFASVPPSTSRMVDVSRVEELARAFITPGEIALRSGRSVRWAMAAARREGIAKGSPAGFPRNLVEEKFLAPALKQRNTKYR